MTTQGIVSCQIPRSLLHKVRTKFFFSVNTFVGILLSITDDTLGLENILNDLPDPPDPADVADADAYKELINSSSTPIFPNQTSVGRVPQILELTEEYRQSEVGDQTDQANLTQPQTPSTLVVDQFPFGNPGAPIPEKPQGSSVYESWEATSMGSLWAPFQSELDWNIARWVKMRGHTSSAVAELLAIPGVCASQ